MISPIRGVVHWHFGYSSFKATDILEALREVRAKVGDDAKISMGFDNAVIHRAHIVTDALRDELDIEPIWNVPARPDLLTVGIEQVWSKAKHLYRQSVDRFKAINR